MAGRKLMPSSWGALLHAIVWPGAQVRRWLPALLCAGIVGLIAAPNFLAGWRPYDAGISSAAATFTLHGLLPYRDYWLLYGPLSGLALALPTALAGPSVELIRVVGLGAILAETAAAFSIARLWASTGPAIAIAAAAIAMYPTLNGLELSGWSLAMAFGLTALAISAWTERPGILIGVLVGLAFLARLDVGAYALFGALVIRDRRALFLGFAIIAVPFGLIAVLTTDVGSLVEQLVWYPLVGPRQFRGLPGLEATLSQPTAAILSLPLVIVPRLAIASGVARHIWARATGNQVPRGRAMLGILVFALLCQLQTLGRADPDHFAQAATPALLLLAIWYGERRLSLARFTWLTAVVALCVVVGLLGLTFVDSDDHSSNDPAIEVTSAWVHLATTDDEPIFVGLTSHRYTATNPLLIYYLSGRRAGVHDVLFIPGVTNTDWAQQRMVTDLERSRTRYLILDRSAAGLYEEWNDSRIPGSTRLDAYIAADFHILCDLETLVIMVRNGEDLPPSPACPTVP